MGIFSGVKNTYRKSEAAVVVQKLLEHQSNIGMFGLDPATTATQLVATIWNAKPDIFNGEFGQRPHKITVAASALANGLNEYAENSNNWTALALSLGSILSEVETNGQLYPLNSLDVRLIDIAGERFEQAASAINLGSKSNDNPKNDGSNKHDVRGKDVKNLGDSDDGLKFIMQELGFDILPEGIKVANKMIKERGLTEFEAASQVSLLTMARDIKECGTDNALRVSEIRSHAIRLIKALDKFKEAGLVNYNSWISDVKAIEIISSFEDRAMPLVDNLIGAEGGVRLATNKNDYNSENDAYKAVGDEQEVASQPITALEHDDENVSQMIDLIVGTLSAQKYLISDERNMLPEKAKDIWSLGYIGGYSDALLQRKGIDTDAAGLAIMTIVYMTIFGEEQGPTYFRKFMDLQREGDPKIIEGMKQGGNEVYTWLSDTDKVPMGWSRYVHGIT